MDPKRIAEIANDCLKEIHPGIDGRGSNMHKAIEAAILQAFRDALETGPDAKMIQAGCDATFGLNGSPEDMHRIGWTAMAAVRLRGMTGGGA